jgi:uncharacterized surface protein with fasciclin (FAS1) repeats
MLCLGLVFSGVNANAAGRSDISDCANTPIVEFNGTIVDAAIATPELSTLVTAVQAAGLVEALSGDGSFTVYAPTNDAFANLPEPILNALLAEPETLLREVLFYHVSMDGHRDPRVARLREIPTVNGQTVFFNRGVSGPEINQSNVSCEGVRTTNGDVWIIDSVLLPQF